MAPSATTSSATPEAPAPPSEIERVIFDAIAKRVFPGAAVAYGTHGGQNAKKTSTSESTLESTSTLGSSTAFAQGFGTYTFDSNIPATLDSIWDVASLTKVLVASTAALILHDAGKLGLDDKVTSHLGASFGVHGKGGVTVRHLLTHTAGFHAWYPFHQMGLRDRDAIIDFIMQSEPVYRPGSAWRYSDLSMIVLGLVIEKVSGMPLDQFAQTKIFAPLGMTATGYRTTADVTWDTRIVPTEVDCTVRDRLLWGEVHDLNCHLMGNVSGHAGLFSSLRDITRFCTTVIDGGISSDTGKRLYSAKASKLFTSRLLPVSPYGWGWNLYSGSSNGNRGSDPAKPPSDPSEPSAPPPPQYRSGGRHLSGGAIGHLGFTGTSMWIDPEKRFYVILLTNTSHSEGHKASESSKAEGIKEVRRCISDAAFEACFPVVNASAPSPPKVGSMSCSHVHVSRHPPRRWKHARDIGALVAVVLLSLNSG